MDKEELQEALDNNDITKDDFDFAYKIVNELIKQIDGKVEQITNFTNKYYELLK